MLYRSACRPIILSFRVVATWASASGDPPADARGQAQLSLCSHSHLRFGEAANECDWGQQAATGIRHRAIELLDGGEEITITSMDADRRAYECRSNHEESHPVPSADSGSLA